MSRAFNHGPMRAACKKFSSQKPAIPAAAAVLLTKPIETEIIRVAARFVDLQEFRHAADYDLSEPFDRAGVLLKIASARAAFTDWRSVRQTRNASIFAAALLFDDRWNR